ncbi:MAG: LptA/OstA family protein [Armatimonadota bacterium]|nr:LptA/OstA family protein [Armatimonadota bacterium]MDR7451352.1 LptA/OstA family protein [Armatimonadota bacterium]MDR7466498.1 LptA/OstA family protein [Armatimonadota bacterium]MDR7493220.1 LptA/OstA family protein [Armatimonadota bacterium]MDR7499427.1 LptA/OstA family protein [Armatimonadota bacterium]
MIRGVGLAALAVLLILSAPTRAQAPPAVEVTGATFADLDEASGLWTLRGSPVTVRRGAVVIQAPALTYERAGQVVRATEGARYADDAFAVDAPRITVWLRDERLLADGGVVAQQRDAQRRLTAERVEAFGRERRLVATGDPVLTGPEGRLAAERIETFLARGEAVAEGNSRIAYDQMEGRAKRITVRQHPPTAVLTGAAVVRQGPHEVRATTVTVDLQRRRVTAQGSAQITAYPGR